MYGVETFVHPDNQSRGIGSKLMEARFDLLRRLNLRGMVAGSMIVGYGEVADRMTADEYVRAVVAGERFDSNLSKQLRKGFRVMNLIPNYTIDARTRNWAAAILWLNPDYRPSLIPLPRKRVGMHPAQLRATGS